MSSKPTLSVKPRPPGTMAGKPPPKPKKPENFKFLRAQFAFIATDEDELSFNEGDLLYIFRKWYIVKQGLVKLGGVKYSLGNRGTQT